MYAAGCNHRAVVQVLLEAGVSRTARDTTDGCKKTAAEWARYNGYADLALDIESFGTPVPACLLASSLPPLLASPPLSLCSTHCSVALSPL